MHIRIDSDDGVVGVYVEDKENPGRFIKIEPETFSRIDIQIADDGASVSFERDQGQTTLGAGYITDTLSLNWS